MPRLPLAAPSLPAISAAELAKRAVSALVALQRRSRVSAERANAAVGRLQCATGRWHTSCGPLALEAEAGADVGVGYEVRGRFGYSAPLFVPPPVAEAAGALVPSVWCAAGPEASAAPAARLMAEALGPRDVDGGATPSAATRGRLSLVALLTPSSDGAPALRSRWRLSGAATLDSYSFAAAPHEDAASGPELVLR